MNSFNEFLRHKDPSLHLEIASVASGLNAGVGATIGNDLVNTFTQPAKNPFTPPQATTPSPQNQQAQKLLATAAGVAGAVQGAQNSLKQSADALAKLGIMKK
jgi:hypothetical protein